MCVCVCVCVVLLHLIISICSSSFKVGSGFGKFSQGSSSNGAAAVADPLPIYSSTSRVHPGFEVDERHQGKQANGEVINGTVDFARNNSKPHSHGISSGNHSGLASNMTEHARRGETDSRHDNQMVRADGDNSPTESSYLRDFDNGSFGETEPTTSISNSDRDHQSETTTVATAMSPPANDDFMEPWVSNTNKPLNPFDDPDFQRYEGNLGSRRQSFGNDSPDGISNYHQGSSDEDKQQPVVFGGGGRACTTNSGANKECRPSKDNLVDSVNFLDYNYPPGMAVIAR